MIESLEEIRGKSKIMTESLEEREKVTESLFFPHLRRTFPFSEPLIRRLGGRVKTIQVRKEHKGFEKISKRSKRGWKLILISRRNHAITLLSS